MSRVPPAARSDPSSFEEGLGRQFPVSGRHPGAHATARVVGRYIADFYCPSERLVIELDGEQHFTAAGRKRDQKRDQYLHHKKMTVLRFENRMVFEHPMMLLQEVRKHFKPK